MDGATGRLAQRRARPDTSLWLIAAALPAIASAASVIVHVDPSSWFSLSPAMRRGLTADLLLYITASMIVAAPTAGVVVGSHARTSSGRRVAMAVSTLVPAVVLFTVTSAAVALFGLGVSDAAARFVLTSHATLAAVALALAAFGAWCGALFRDPLDAAACSLTIVLIAAGGLFVAGASVADAPPEFLDAALTASPFVAVASAAHIDVVRMGVPYQISPLAHLQVNYPSWQAASGWYLAIAGVCLAGFAWSARAARVVSSH
jgi:hypothetical protein